MPRPGEVDSDFYQKVQQDTGQEMNLVKHHSGKLCSEPIDGTGASMSKKKIWRRAGTWARLTVPSNFILVQDARPCA